MFCLLFCFCFVLAVLPATAQTTSWTGAHSTGWYTSANWTSGVPNASLHAVIGDEHHTGRYNPVATGSINAKSVLLGSTKTASITLYNSKSHLTISGSLTIGTLGTLNHSGSTLKVAGNWSNTGKYVPARSTQGKKVIPTVIFTGTGQTLTGTTSFMGLTINQGSTTTIASPISVTVALSVSGTLDPGKNLLTLAGSTFTLTSSGIAKVKAATYSGNYSIGPTTLHTGGTIDYAATDINQTIAPLSNRPYSVLVVSGGMTKTLTNHITFSAASTFDGQLLVNAGIMNLGGFTANRATSTLGGTVSVANDATLRIGGTNTFPANYAERSLGTTSTVEYNGAIQTVSSEAYGNLLLSASTGSPTKTFAAAPITISGNLTSSNTGTGVLTFTASQSLTINGNILIGAGTIFNGGNFTHTLDGDWANNGTFNGGTGTGAIALRGTGKTIAGASHTFFNNLSIDGSITGKAINITVAGNLSASGAGTFIHAAESSGTPAAGTFTMSGTGKTITGLGYTFDNLTVSGSISSASDLTVNGNLLVTNTNSNAFNLTDGTIHLTGLNKTLSTGTAGSLNLHSLRITGTVTTGSSFRIKADLSGNGLLTANAGTITFSGTSTYGANFNLFNVTLNGNSLQLAANASLGITGNLTLTSGTFDVTTTSPNTVEYNGNNQNITGTTYHHIIMAGTGTKTGVANLTANGYLQVNSGVTFSAGNFTHTIQGNWINSGTFNPNTSTIRFTGVYDASITGATTFTTLTVEKSSATNTIFLNNHVNASTVNMVAGAMQTRAQVLTIANTRTGPGIIHGTITRAHAFSAGTTYAFSGPNNTLTFGSASNINSVTVRVVPGSNVSSFPSGGAINRLYTVTIPSGTYSNATWRMTYREQELNGNTAEDLNIYQNTASTWTPIQKTGSSLADRWVEATGLSNISGNWTFSNLNSVVQWRGTISQDWHTPSNWVVEGSTIERVPLASDIVEIGQIPFSRQPVISANAVARSVQFGSASPVTLTLAGGNLEVGGNINGLWSENASHTLSIGSQRLAIGGDLELSDGETGHDINLTVATGTVHVEQSLTQSGNAAITFTGAGNLIIGDDYNYTNGLFTAGSSTVTYQGDHGQTVAGNINYNHLVINSSDGVATVSAATVAGDLRLLNKSVLLAEGNLTVKGNLSLAPGTTFDSGAFTHEMGGNWTNNGTFVPSSGTVKFNGSGPQTVNATTFNQLLVEKGNSTLTLTDNIRLNGNITISAGAVDLQTFTLNRSAAGGNFNMAANTALYLAGTANYPANFNANNLNATSTVYYNGTSTQNVARVSYGNLVFQNGGTNAKTLLGATTVKGDLNISNGSTLQTGSFTVTAEGNVTSYGTVNPGTGTLTLAGKSKTISGKFNLYNLIVTGSYNMVSDTTRVLNDFNNAGSIAVGNGVTIFSGNVTNSGNMSTDGTVIYTGTRLQTIRLVGTMSSTSSGKMILTGSVAPILVSNSVPTFITVIIDNTAGITASIGWTVNGLLQVNAGSTFNGGIYTHNLYGAFMNEGTVTSSGVLNFSPTTDRTLALGSSLHSTGTLRFGGSGKITLTSCPQNLTNIEVTNTHAAGVIPSRGWNISNNLMIEQGSTFNGGTALSHSITGAFINDGTFNGNSSTFTFNTINASISGSGTTNFHHLVINDSTTVLTDINIKGNLYTNGELNLEYNEVHFNGNTAQEITGTAETNFYDLFVANNTAAVSALRNLNVENALIIGPGGVFKPAPEVVVNTSGTVGTLTGTGTIEVTRILAQADFINQYKFVDYDLKALTVKFSGTAAQSSTLTSFHNLTVSNPSGFSLLAPTTVAGTLRLENSILYSNGHLLTVGTSATTTGSVEVTGSGFVSGKLQRWLSASVGADITFPVGQSTTRRVATIQYTVAPSGGTLTAEFVPSDPGISGLPLTQQNSNHVDYKIAKTGTSGYWTLTAGTTGSEALTGGVYKATFEAINFGGIDKLTHFVVLKRADKLQPWTLEGTHVAASGTESSLTISRTGLSGFSDFAIGGEEVSSLPVTLAGFQAKKNGNNAVLTWKTATETNNAGFSVEVSPDGHSFRAIGFVKSNTINSSIEQQYSFIDIEAGKSGIRYYRLRQQDLDSQYAYSAVRALSFSTGSETIAAYPNPFVHHLEVSIEVATAQPGRIILYDLNGRQIWEDSKALVKGNNQVAVAIPEKVGQGTYLLRVITDQAAQSIKVVKN